MLSVLKSGENNLAVTFFEARTAFVGKGISASWAADARFILWRFKFLLIKRPAASETDLALAAFKSVGDRDPVVKHKAFPLP